MSDIAIKVENLGKSYLVGHNSVRSEHCTSLRDLLAHNARNLARTTRDMLRGRAIVQGDEVEEYWALKDVSFEIKSGDRVGVIGRNGAGKSTLLKILSRITEPTKGRVLINGRVASLLEVGTGFHSELSGRENIFLNGAILGMTRQEIQHKFDAIVDFAEVDKFLDTPVKRYSSGMYVRLAFSVAAHLEPEILIVDEVLAVGDAQFQQKCMGKMEEVGKDGRTVIFVSHNMSAIRKLCSTVIHLQSGLIVDQGNVDEQLEKFAVGLKGVNQESGFKSIYLGRDAILADFALSKGTLESGDSLNYNITIKSENSCSLSALSILFYSSAGVRVAVADLRDINGIAWSLKPGEQIKIEGVINCLPFVEGRYSLGLFVSVGDHTDNHFNLLDLIVAPKETSGFLIPYPAHVRGVLELDYYNLNVTRV